MKFRRLIVRLLVVCAFFVSLEKVAAADDAWLKAETANFQLFGNAGEGELRRAGERLERFRAALGRLFPGTKFSSPVPTRVIVFGDLKSFQKFQPAPVPEKWRGAARGFFQPGDEVNYVVLAPPGETGENHRQIYHEYTHYLLENSFGRSNIPPWLGEGLAAYYERLAFKDATGAVLGEPHDGHLAVLGQNKLIPLENFFAQDYYSLHSQNRETSALFRAQSWALVHYLLGDEKSTGRLRRFIELLGAGRDRHKAFFEAFEIDSRTVEADLKRYVEAGKFAGPALAKLDFTGAEKALPVSFAEARAIEGDLLFRLGRFDEAERVLRATTRSDADSSAAAVTLGMLKARERNFEEAAVYLEQAVRADPRNYLAHYASALVISREEMIGYGFVAGYSPAQAEKMRGSLRRAIALNPSFAESYQLLAFVDYVRNEELDDGLAMIGKALELAPGNQWYQLRRAQLLTRRERFTEARLLMLKIIPTAPDDRLRVYAENTLTVLNSLEAQLLSLKNKKTLKYEDDLITDEPVSEEELRRRREKAMIESLNLALRIPAPAEKRVLGTVTGIECREGAIFVSVKTEDRQLRLRADSFNKLILIAYDNELVASQFGCGMIKKDGFSVVTYRPPADQTAAATGEIIAIEFVPKYFKFLGVK